MYIIKLTITFPSLLSTENKPSKIINFEPLNSNMSYFELN